MKVSRSVLGGGVLCASLLSGEVALAATVTVDGGTRFQTISGWEATAYAGQDAPTYPAFRDTIYRMAAEDLGLNRIRIEVRASSEHTRDLYQERQAGTIDQATWRASRYTTVNDNADPNDLDMAGFHFTELDEAIDERVARFRQEVQRAGGTLHVNLCYVAFTGQNGPSTSYIHDDADEYAELVEATYRHLDTKYGWVPDTWEVLLEPDLVSQWDGTKIGQAMVAAAARIQALGHTPRFVAPSTTNMGNANPWFDAMAAVPGATDFLAELSYHRYSGTSVGAGQGIRTRTLANGVGASMLEHIGADYNELHEDLTVANVVSWQQFTFGGPNPSDDGSGYFRVDVTNPSSPVVNYASRTRYLRQYFKYVRQGAVRVAATANDGVQAVAFENVGGGYVVVAKSSASAPVTVAGLPDGDYGVTYTTSSAFGTALPDVTVTGGSSVSATLPAAGVITFFARTSVPDGGAGGSGGASGAGGASAGSGGAIVLVDAGAGDGAGAGGTSSSGGVPGLGGIGSSGGSSSTSGGAGPGVGGARSTGGGSATAGGPSSDGGMEGASSGDDSGCGCRTVRERSPSAAAMSFGLVALLLGRRRRPRKSA